MVIDESSALVRMTPAAVAYFLTHRAPKLTTTDTVVLADFEPGISPK
jgi:hypothetical protein